MQSLEAAAGAHLGLPVGLPVGRAAGLGILHGRQPETGAPRSMSAALTKPGQQTCEVVDRRCKNVASAVNNIASG